MPTGNLKEGIMADGKTAKDCEEYTIIPIHKKKDFTSSENYRAKCNHLALKYT